MKTHGLTKGPEWFAWCDMRKRCENPRTKGFERYGGRGIRVCARWQTFENFIADMGSRPTPRHSIDRINNDGDYEPGNCRWALPVEQANNRGVTRFVVIGDRTNSATAWDREAGLPKGTVRRRFLSGRRGADLLSPLSAEAQRRGRNGRAKTLRAFVDGKDVK